LENAKEFGVKKLLFLGSACAYPKWAENPILESSLLTGELEPSNECYALAKISGIKLCEAYRRQYGCDFISVMPTNLYGVGDHYDPTDSHVIPGMIHRFHQAATQLLNKVTLWGSGTVTRDFLFADDLADACLVLMEHAESLGLVNVGSGETITLRQLAREIASVVDYTGLISWDMDKPDGTPRRQLNLSKIKSLGWGPKTVLPVGLRIAYADFVKSRLHSA
jgi:GDP-L-fucose synthase